MSNCLYAQDETYFANQVKQKEQDNLKEISEQVNWKVSGPLLEIDLINDSQKEFVQVEKKADSDFFYLYGHNREKIFSLKLPKKGSGSYLYKIKKTNLTKDIVALVLFYYTGSSQYLNFRAESKIIIVTYHQSENNFYSFEGPALFSENKSRDHYHNRTYKVSFDDLNRDGILDLKVTFGSISRAYSYEGKGVWISP